MIWTPRTSPNKLVPFKDFLSLLIIDFQLGRFFQHIAILVLCCPKFHFFNIFQFIKIFQKLAEEDRHGFCAESKNWLSRFGSRLLIILSNLHPNHVSKLIWIISLLCIPKLKCPKLSIFNSFV